MTIRVAMKKDDRSLPESTLTHLESSTLMVLRGCDLQRRFEIKAVVRLSWNSVLLELRFKVVDMIL